MTQNMIKHILPYSVVTGIDEGENSVEIAISLTFTIANDENIGELIDFFKDNIGSPMELELTLTNEVKNE